MIINQRSIIDKANQAIVEIIGKYVELKSKGSSHEACCPFHNEKTPSFKVSKKRGYYKCFGCQAGGDAISFIQEFENVTFPEALEIAARLIGEVVEYDNKVDREEFIQQRREEKQRRDALSIQLEHVVNAYREASSTPTVFKAVSNLSTKQWDPLLEFDGRTWHSSTVKAFQICFSPDSNLITKLMPTQHWPAKLLLQLGAIRDNDGSQYDVFRGRLLFPISNHRGQAIALAGRARPGQNKRAKYLNSQESILYRKREHLYGLYQALKSIEEKGSANLVEGYTDVITLHDVGITNTVGTLGTAFTKEQANKLRSYTKEVVIIRDGDTAGRQATIRDIEVAAQAGLFPSVVILPPGEDPDSMARKVGGNSLWQYIKKNKEDGIIWRVMLEWDDDEVFKQQEAFQLAANLIACYDSNVVTSAYLKKLTAKSRMGSVTRELKKAIEQKMEDQLIRGERKLTPEQQRDVLNYGVYEMNHKYYACRNAQKGIGIEISNFIVKPLMLIVARQESRRLIEIVNEFGHSFIADIDSSVFSSFDRFADFVEGQGNYLYNEEAKKPYHVKIKRKVYHNMPTCYPIYTMGWHKEGFWTWSNGLFTPGGKFLSIDDYGVVSFDETKFFLKPHSKIERDIKSDDDEDSMKDQKNFMYHTKPKTMTFKEWSRQMKAVHGKNGMMAVAWFMAAVFRDIIYPYFNCFPHLFCFGPPQAGKSFMAWSLQYMFGAEPKGPTHIVHATDAAFTRAFSWVRNGVTWMDEYGNEATFERVEALKMAYDGTGREKAKGGYGHAITRTPINSAVMITGQQQPTQDIALMTRCVFCNFPEHKYTEEEERRANQLRQHEQSGELTQITMQILQHRDLIEKEFLHMFDLKKSRIRSMVQLEGVNAASRMLLNYCIILSVADLLARQFEFGFGLDELEEFVIDSIIRQSDSIDNQDECAIFWNIIAFLISKHIVQHDQDIIVEPASSVTYMDDSKRGERKDSLEEKWKEEKVLIFLNLTKCHGEYLERHQRTRNKPGLDIEALKFYLRGSQAYIGQKRGKKFNGRTKSCYVFDRDKLNVELLMTSEWLSKES